MGFDIKVTFSMIKFMGMGIFNGLMKNIIKGIGGRVRCMVRVYFMIQMEVSTKVNLKMVKSMEKGYTKEVKIKKQNFLNGTMDFLSHGFIRRKLK